MKKKLLSVTNPNNTIYSYHRSFELRKIFSHSCKFDIFFMRSETHRRSKEMIFKNHP